MTISHEAHVLAERDLPCKRQNWCLEWDGKRTHFSDCPADHRPVVAATYQRFMDEIAELKLALLVGTNHLEGIDFSGPGRKRMQSARSWYVTVREKFALAAKEGV